MIELNKNDLCLEIKEYLTWNTVQNIYDTLIERYFDDEIGEALSKYELTKEDKIEILDMIRDEYEYQSEDDFALSIFDDELIINVLNEWIENKFN